MTPKPAKSASASAESQARAGPMLRYHEDVRAALGDKAWAILCDLRRPEVVADLLMSAHIPPYARRSGARGEPVPLAAAAVIFTRARQKGLVGGVEMTLVKGIERDEEALGIEARRAPSPPGAPQDVPPSPEEFR